MKAFEKTVSFPTRPFKLSASSKGSDENDRGDQEMDLNTGKLSMSPTGSAASEATFQRRKILAERNESIGSNFPNNSKTPNLDSKSKALPMTKASQKNSLNLETKVFPQKTPLSYNSRDETPSPTPYDPLTNYLSPRPQFLRYDPGRRKHILLRLNMKDKEVEDTLSSSSSFDSNKAATDETASCSCEECSSSCEGEEFAEEIGSYIESDEEELEEEVGRSWGFKYFFWLVVLVLATGYVCSMNGPTPTQEFQIYSNGTVGRVDVGCKFLNARPKQVGLLGLNRCVLDESVEEGMAESVSRKELFGLEVEGRNHVEPLEIVEEEVKNDENVEEVAYASDQFPDDKTTVKTEYVKENGESGDIVVDELVETKEISVHLVKLLETVESEAQVEDVEKIEVVKGKGESEDVIEDELVKTEVTNGMVEDIDRREEHVRMTVSKEAAFILSDGSEYVTEEELVETGEVTNWMARDIEQLGEEHAIVQVGLLSGGSDHHQENASHTSEREVTNESGREIQKEPTHENMVQGKSSSLNVEEVNPLKGLNHKIGTDLLVKVLFGVLAGGTFVASFVMAFKFTGKAFGSRHLSKVDKHSIKPVVEEKPSLVNTLPLINCQDKDSEESYQRRAPSVELLGELAVGAISSSTRSCSRVGMSSGVNIYSDFLEKDLGSKASSAPAHDHQNLSVNSSEKLTPKKQVLRKVIANNDTTRLDGEGRNEVITPLRRSTRLRNRAVTSP